MHIKYSPLFGIVVWLACMALAAYSESLQTITVFSVPLVLGAWIVGSFAIVAAVALEVKLLERRAPEKA